MLPNGKTVASLAQSEVLDTCTTVSYGPLNVTFRNLSLELEDGFSGATMLRASYTYQGNKLLQERYEFDKGTMVRSYRYSARKMRVFISISYHGAVQFATGKTYVLENC